MVQAGKNERRHLQFQMDPGPEPKLPGWAKSPAKYLSPPTSAIMKAGRDEVVSMEQMEEPVHKGCDVVSKPKKFCKV